MLRVSGENVDLGEALRGRIAQRVEEIVRTYFDGGYDGRATVEPEGPAFRSAAHGGVNVVYRRTDGGNVGWIDPELAKGRG